MARRGAEGAEEKCFPFYLYFFACNIFLNLFSGYRLAARTTYRIALIFKGFGKLAANKTIDSKNKNIFWVAGHKTFCKLSLGTDEMS